MFPVLLAATFLASLLVCAMTVVLFLPPIRRILEGRLSPQATMLWTRSLLFAVCVVGVAVGARIWDLQRYLSAPEITTDQLSLEVYKTVIATGEANVAVILLVSLGVAVVALMKRRDSPEGCEQEPAKDVGGKEARA
ncbi:hypothetical protein [Phenylobacterium soli]|uniref:Uncharacterized protein n=1 Tax=Phenylobacterium soli TaxID=2170551 RepID=A0A328AIR7_9CAUL|nr:hypothetical protein [Phenylobacterium soli]RAK53304.1 hypothetical protein DJ017_01555 [Phenylobacterium soli]